MAAITRSVFATLALVMALRLYHDNHTTWGAACAGLFSAIVVNREGK